MKKMNELLSICIPTYKRNDLLIKSLELILPFVKEKKIAVYINDNDKDSKLFENNKFQEIILKCEGYINYKKNDPELNQDKNLLDVLLRNRSKYSLWMGDDDYIFSKDLEKIYFKLENNDYDLVILDKTRLSYEEFLKIEKGQKINLKYFNKNIYGEYDSIEKFYQKNGDNFSHGNLIIRNEYLKYCNFNEYMGTCHITAGVVFEVLDYLEEQNKKIKVLVDNESIIYMLTVPRSWLDFKEQAVVGEMTCYLKANSRYKKILIRKNFGNIKRLCGLYILARKNKNIEDELKKIEPFVVSKFSKIFILLYLRFYENLRFIYRRIKGRKNETF